jgi:hypothetical protein
MPVPESKIYLEEDGVVVVEWVAGVVGMISASLKGYEA